MLLSKNSRYEVLSLETNPFPFTPIPRRPWILGGKSRIEIYNRIKNEILLSRNLNEPKVNVILGEYGYGKTHIAEHLINYGLSDKQFKIFIHTIQDPMNKPALPFLAIRFLNSLGGEKFLRELSGKIFLKLIKSNERKLDEKGVIKLSIVEKIFCLLERKFKELKIKDIINEIEEDPEIIRKLVEGGRIDGEKLINLEENEIKNIFDTEQKSLHLRNFVSLDVFKEILLLPLSGYWKYYDSRRYNKLLDKISKSNEDALLFIATLINLIKYISGETIVSIVDEVDAISPIENVDLFFHSLRLLVDRGPGSLYILILCTPRAWGNYLQNSMLGNVKAVESRMGARPILLESISLEEAKDIISKYLEAVSLEKESRIFERIFDPGVVDLLYRESGGNIRQLLVFCFYCIEYVSQNNLKKVSYDIAEKVLSEIRIPEARVTITIPLEPDSDTARQIIKKFYSIEKPSERGKTLERAIGELINRGLGRESNLGKKRISVGLKGKREMDIVFYDNMHKVNGIEVKAYDKERLIGLKQLEGFIEVVKKSSIERLILLSTSELSVDARRELDKHSKHKNLKICILNEKQIAIILYATNTFPELSRQLELKREEAINILKDLEIV
jgi:hypothetical protein